MKVYVDEMPAIVPEELRDKFGSSTCIFEKFGECNITKDSCSLLYPKKGEKNECKYLKEKK